MNYGELSTYFKQLLNRTDATETQIDFFISLGLRRTERLMRTPLQRVIIEFTVPEGWDQTFGIPDDYLGFYYLKVNGKSLNRTSANGADVESTGTPSEFFMDGGSFLFRPSLSTGDVIRLNYFQEFLQGVSDDHFTNYSVVVPDIIVYASLTYAADFFSDVRKDSFENTFKTLMDEIQLMSDIEEMSGGLSIQNPYAGIA